VIAVHLSELDGERAEQFDAELRQKWDRDVITAARAAGVTPPRLTIRHSPYRTLLSPLLRFIEETKTEFPGRPIAVIVPERIKQHWWQYLLHTRRAMRLRSGLLQAGDHSVMVVNVPWVCFTNGNGAQADHSSDTRALHDPQ
jgi:hypothetical protein